jgi:hypothetical protein
MGAIRCGRCATDEYVSYDAATGMAVCSGPGHRAERRWEPAEDSGLDDLPGGVDGLDAALLHCLVPGEWAETGVAEHRYGEAHPEPYEWMVDRWGRVALGARRYSVTSYIGARLGALSRAAEVMYRPGPGTGFYSYNRRVGYWTLLPVLAETITMTFARLAQERGFRPKDFPLLEYRADG